ncbi:MAG TPA: PP2C family protein-serine/threonine phosphatase, partial [Tepidisphaeraceae bacterium]
MISRKRFQFGRVIVMHGVLLVAVAVVAYFSGRAQYNALHDQRLEEVKSQQQAAARAIAQSLQQTMRIYVARLMTAHDFPADSGLPKGWSSGGGVIDAQSRVVQWINDPAAQPPSAEEAAQWSWTDLKQPALIPLDDASADGLLLIVPRHDRQQAFVTLLSAGPILGTSAVGPTARGTTLLLLDEKTVVAGKMASGAEKGVAGLVRDDASRTQINELVSKVVSGTILVEENDPAGPSLLTLQIVELLPDTRASIALWRPGEGELISQAIRPVVWQLVSGAGLMVAAVAIVLSSTTLSLVRGRQRIEQLRLAMLKNDLEKARHIQLKWLPEPYLKSDCIEIAAENEPASHISGDFYNWFDLPQGEEPQCRQTALIIGDVSGHGMPAAFLMATTQLIVRNTLPNLRDPGKCLTEVNRQLCSMVYNGQFVTMLIMVIDHDRNEIAIASAGQSPPLLRRDHQVRPLDVDPDLVAGVDDAVVYQSHHVKYCPGDSLLLYTDG